MPRAFTFVICLLVAPAQGSEIERADITFTGNSYSYVFSGMLDGTIDRVRELVTDYEHQARLNDSFVASAVLETCNNIERLAGDELLQ